MGQAISKHYDSLLGHTSSTILLLGLDAVGKTTLLLHLDPSLIPAFSPMYCPVETLEWRNATFVSWAVVVNLRYWPMIKHYCQAAGAVIFMVDSSDRDRVEEARDVLEWMLEEAELVGKPLLVLGNKQDLPGGLDWAELEGRLALREVRGRQWRLQLCSMVTLEGLLEGFEWLSRVLARKAGTPLW